MDEQKKDAQEYSDIPVDNAVKDGENLVDEQGETVENMGTETETQGEISENVEVPVDMSDANVDNTVENKESAVQFQGTAGEEDVSSVDGTVDTGDNSQEKWTTEEIPSHKDGGVWWKVFLGLVAFAGVMAYCWFATGGGVWKATDIAITYLKNNGLYTYDLKNDPYLVNDGVTNGGESNYYYSAWGANVSEDNEDLYYMAGVTADSVGSLYYKNLKNKDAAPVLISENVYHFLKSADGSACAYLTLNKEKMDLYVFENGQNQLIDENILVQNGAYELSPDGAYVVYKKANGEQAQLYMRTLSEKESVKLTDTAVLDFIAEKTSNFYYLEQKDDSYQLYQIVQGEEPKLVAEQVTYAELMPNKQDVLFSAMRTGDSSFEQLIEDDVTDLSALDEKRKGEVEAIREKMNGEEGIDPIFQDCFILTPSGNKIRVGETIISSVSLQDQSGFVGGFSMVAPEPVKLSEISSFDEAMYTYYSALMYGQKNVFIADKTGKEYTLQTPSAVPTSIQVSPNGKVAAYFVQDQATGGNTLMVEDLNGKGEPIELQTNVEKMAFLGDGETLVYYYDYEGGMGTLGMYKNGTAQEIQKNAVGVYFPVDKDEVYYMAGTDTTTGSSTLLKFDGKGTTEIDRAVFVFQYKENGKFAYLKNYDVKTGIGDLYYYDGKAGRQIDTGVTAIYIY